MREAKPLRIASGVIDCNHKRSIGFLILQKETNSRKISSPSRPASQALTTASTSALLANLAIMRKRVVHLSLAFKLKLLGIMGRSSNFQALYLGSISSGAINSTKWPTAQVIMLFSLSKYSFSSLQPPNALAISLATLGFSAIIRCLDKSSLLRCLWWQKNRNMQPIWQVGKKLINPSILLGTYYTSRSALVAGLSIAQKGAGMF